MPLFSNKLNIALNVAEEMSVSVEIKDGNFAVLTLKREPVNALSLETWHELHIAFKLLEEDSRL